MDQLSLPETLHKLYHVKQVKMLYMNTFITMESMHSDAITYIDNITYSLQRQCSLISLLISITINITNSLCLLFYGFYKYQICEKDMHEESN
jgi:hypothetical protein